jgi:hypothetical protein
MRAVNLNEADENPKQLGSMKRRSNRLPRDTQNSLYPVDTSAHRQVYFDDRDLLAGLVMCIMMLGPLVVAAGNAVSAQ